jgi:fructokinase
MRKIIGIGETIIDIIFKNGQPVSAKPGGSAFNTLISLGRLNTQGIFISETGNDQLGESIKQCLKENNLSTDYINQFKNSKSHLALAFLNEENNADYVFYKDYSTQRLEIEFPEIQQNDILIYGSFFALNQSVRLTVKKLLDIGVKKEAIIYYDPNFRKTHVNELEKLSPILEENFSYSDIVRGSDEDFYYIFGEKDVDVVYEKMKKFCPNFICTAAEKGVFLRTQHVKKWYDTPSIIPVSTVGAGDSFNAGVLYALDKYNISKSELSSLDENKWDKLIHYAILFSSNVCLTYENYISKELAQEVILNKLR